jgi:hypothetical protein
MLTTARDVRRDRAPARDSGGAVVSLKFRDRLRIEFDKAFRDCFIRVSCDFKPLPTPTWKEMRRDPIRNDRPWGRLLRTIDEAVRDGAPLEPLLELPGILESYIRIRYEQHQLPTVAAQIEAEEDASLSLRKVA